MHHHHYETSDPDIFNANIMMFTLIKVFRYVKMAKIIPKDNIVCNHVLLAQSSLFLVVYSVV